MLNYQIVVFGAAESNVLLVATTLFNENSTAQIVNVEGWDDTDTMVFDTVAKANGDGSYLKSVKFGEREITVTINSNDFSDLDALTKQYLSKQPVWLRRIVPEGNADIRNQIFTNNVYISGLTSYEETNISGDGATNYTLGIRFKILSPMPESA